MRLSAVFEVQAIAHALPCRGFSSCGKPGGGRHQPVPCSTYQSGSSITARIVNWETSSATYKQDVQKSSCVSTGSILGHQCTQWSMVVLRLRFAPSAVHSTIIARSARITSRKSCLERIRNAKRGMHCHLPNVRFNKYEDMNELGSC